MVEFYTSVEIFDGLNFLLCKSIGFKLSNGIYNKYFLNFWTKNSPEMMENAVNVGLVNLLTCASLIPRISLKPSILEEDETVFE